MQLIERQVIKPNHRFLPEADRLFLVSKKLYNCDNNISGQNFSPGKLTNDLAIDPVRSKSVGDQALPAKVRQNTLWLQLTALTSDRGLRLAIARTQLTTKFPVVPQMPDCANAIEKRRKKRYVVVCQCQAVRQNDFLKGYASWSGTNI
ncbi:MAG: hypothetical protein JGK17_18900 [Microcoleus sp. PH2017_10_PVI_O_A]|uniref:hypothetical protein n=1 Tax=unclassified Microcoleus TaxID=2642155 RepID=UPI001DFB0421|nr:MULTISPECIES: hypothetical protein [unclassified Microcoleus]TAE80431.1 MAG: hypothetical protein EAZ83_18275 [Oscillatoriales cyanobacterium]MCC3407623.1 hypothetical protein [Microcoleus sp. PH2017_10_PVI_O_A]MCC3461801.1 hypothetical protein [Microcoleus sp. PH2017_11_PCY_U_A]MCC3480215.1 hypothetical protein [Microcoleus sp. PH2017_12_PCY_D_A]MCC3526582.1 hypothetical protein [Microcoleus sp. PH2017_21_RUC_O_A]